MNETASSPLGGRGILNLLASLAAIALSLRYLVDPLRLSIEEISGLPPLATGYRKLYKVVIDFPWVASYLELLLYTGLAAIVLAAVFSVFLGLRTREGVAQRIGSALAMGSLGFALLHYSAWLDSVLGDPARQLRELLGIALVVAGGFEWAIAVRHYPRRLTKEEFLASYRQRLPELRKRRNWPRLVRRLAICLWRWQRIERHFYARLGIRLRVRGATSEQFTVLERFEKPSYRIGLLLFVLALVSLRWFVPDFLERNVIVLAEGTLLMTLPMVIALANTAILAQYHAGDETVRRRLTWLWLVPSMVIMVLFIAFLLSLGLGLSGLVPDAILFTQLLLPAFPVLLGASVVLSIVLSVLSRGSFDTRLAFRRSAVYGIVGLLLTMLFVAVEGLLSTHAALTIGLPNETGAVLTGTMAALMFGPVRNKVEVMVNGWVERRLPAGTLAEASRDTAAICFNDLSGYTALSETDEDAALIAAQLVRQSGLRVARDEGGRVVKCIGDAVLMEFPDVDAAVVAARRLHEDFRRACRVEGIDPMPVHSGIHFGPVARGVDGDVYGRTVNIAARLEGEAGSDEIVLSSTARDALRDASEFEPMGPRTLKNVSEPVECFRLKTLQTDN